MARKGRWTPRILPSGSDHRYRKDPTLILKGSSVGTAKLTESDVREIREAFAGGGVSKAELGRRYGVTRTAIYMAVTGKSWRNT